MVNYRRHSLFSHSLNEDRENSETHRVQEYVALQPIITMTAWLSKTVGPYSDGNVGNQETPFSSGLVAHSSALVYICSAQTVLYLF